MLASLNDLSLVHDTDLVSVADRREAMGDHDRRPVTHQVLKRFLHQSLRLRIESGSRLIQDQDRRVLQDGPGDADPLPLTTGELSAPSSHARSP